MRIRSALRLTLSLVCGPLDSVKVCLQHTQLLSLFLCGLLRLLPLLQSILASALRVLNLSFDLHKIRSLQNTVQRH